MLVEAIAVSTEELLELQRRMRSIKKLKQLRDDIRSAVETQDTEKLKEYAYEIERRQLGSEMFDSRFLELILTLLSDPDVLALGDAGPILAPLEFDADKLTPSQRRMVVEALVWAYPRFADRMAQFYITEFVGRKFADENALWLFVNLREVNDEQARALVPHGFEHLACSADSAVAPRAFEYLTSLMSDGSVEVVSEVLLSLARVVEHGGVFASDADKLLRSAAKSSAEPIGGMARTLLANAERPTE